MTQQSNHSSADTATATPQASNRRMRGLMDDAPKEEFAVSGVLDMLALRMYIIASMLVGEGEQSVEVVEKAVAKLEVTPCEDAAKARKASKIAVVEMALDTLVSRNANCLNVPDELAPSFSCIDEDDLSSAGLSHDELEYLIEGPDRGLMRKWLMGLPTSLRAIFVLRAVAGFSTTESAELLLAHGGPVAAGWTDEAVRDTFRQGLCSLASQLIHSSAPR